VYTVLDAVFLRRLEILHLPQGPRKGPLFYLWLSINCGIGANDSSRAQLPCTPVVADSGRAAYTARLFHFSEWICISQNFNDRRTRAAKRKGQAMDRPALTTALLGRHVSRAQS
jgi:hypothetical protein